MPAFVACWNTGTIASPKSGYVTIALTCWAIIDLKSAIAWLRSECALL